MQPPENGSISYNKSLVRNGGYPVDTLASFMCQIVNNFLNMRSVNMKTYLSEYESEIGLQTNNQQFT